ncbi:unnamed protein product [Prorocentrum cordatum]|uniref:Uncharacterized protein n=1 Tax=Prorocentrum cordatum TaxID=2364126 RepID=A0ABN9TWD8_9DINO|nr:unnamed protein product [Polarella glacialis]
MGGGGGVEIRRAPPAAAQCEERSSMAMTKMFSAFSPGHGHRFFFLQQWQPFRAPCTYLRDPFFSPSARPCFGRAGFRPAPVPGSGVLELRRRGRASEIGW